MSIECAFAKDSAGRIRQFRALTVKSLGPTPRTLLLPDAQDPSRQNPNPTPEDADRFLRAASGVRFLDTDAPENELMGRQLELITAQDSRRKLGTAKFGLTLAELLAKPELLIASKQPPAIGVIPVESADVIARDERDTVDYASARKAKKRDFEAMTTLPRGDLLILGSGSDTLKLLAGKSGYRSLAVFYDPRRGTVASHDLAAFYKLLLANRDVVGPDGPGGQAELNLEGVAVRPRQGGHVIAFFHRGNTNGNGHNAIVEFDLDEWLTLVEGKLSAESSSEAWSRLRPLRIVKLQLPWIPTAGDPGGQAVPLTINDALVSNDPGRPTIFIPAGAEADYTDAQGIQHDGVVTFAGMIRLQLALEPTSGESSCLVLQAPGDPAPGLKSVFGKIEGLAAFGRGGDAYQRSLLTDASVVVGVTDVDSEIAPSTVSVLDLKPD
jgi:hypothetical protein